MAYRYQYTLCEHLPPLVSFIWQAAISLRKLIVTLTHFFFISPSSEFYTRTTPRTNTTQGVW